VVSFFSGLAGSGEPVWVHMLSHSPVKIIANIFKELILINHIPLRFAAPNGSGDRQKKHGLYYQY
jgi:hypothetical protein